MSSGSELPARIGHNPLREEEKRKNDRDRNDIQRDRERLEIAFIGFQKKMQDLDQINSRFLFSSMHNSFAHSKWDNNYVPKTYSNLFPASPESEKKDFEDEKRKFKTQQDEFARRERDLENQARSDWEASDQRERFEVRNSDLEVKCRIFRAG